MRKLLLFCSVLSISIVLQSGCVADTDSEPIPPVVTTPTMVNSNGSGYVNNYGTVPAHLISSNTIWEDVFADPSMVDYVVNTHVIVSAGTLTIKPGVRIQFVNNKSLTANNGIISAIGTASNPILLEGQTTTRGSWIGVSTNRAGSTIQHAQIRHAITGIQATDNISVVNTTIEQCQNYGVQLLEGVFATDFSNNKIANCGIAMDIIIQAVSQINGSTQFINNTQNYVQVHPNGSLEGNVMFNELSIPYLMQDDGNFVISKGASVNTSTCTFAPGVVVEFPPNQAITYMGGVSVKAIGTASKKVVFRNKNGALGRWKGLRIYGSNTNHQFEQCIFDGGGEMGSLAPAMVNFLASGNTSVTNSQFNNSAACAIYTSNPNSFTQYNNIFTAIAGGTNICQ